MTMVAAKPTPAAWLSREAWRAELAWHRSLLPRAGTLWAYKALCMTGLVTVFFVAYFALLAHPQFAVTAIPATAIDDVIPFSANALPMYLTLWLYLSLPPGLLGTRRELHRYYLGIIGLALAGLTCFLFWPTMSPRPDIDWTLYPVFGPLLAVDRAGNACPSLHAAFAVFTAIWFDRMLRHPGDLGLGRALNAAWCLAILHATLATKQHVMIDALAGAALGAAAAWIHARCLPTGWPGIATQTDH